MFSPSTTKNLQAKKKLIFKSMSTATQTKCSSRQAWHSLPMQDFKQSSNFQQAKTSLLFKTLLSLVPTRHTFNTDEWAKHLRTLRTLGQCIRVNRKNLSPIPCANGAQITRGLGVQRQAICGVQPTILCQNGSALFGYTTVPSICTKALLRGI